jgi:hypothetical protein
MTKRAMLTTAALGMLTWLTPGVARAQGYVQPQTNPYGRAPLSPYLNMLHGGDPAINYHGLVKPQLQTNQSLLALQQQQVQPTATIDPSILPTTGHPTRFLNYSHYFFNQGGSGTYDTLGGGAYGPYGGGGVGNPGANPFLANTFPARTGFGNKVPHVR